MSATIHHLPGIESRFEQTSRLPTHLLASGSPGGEPVLFLHGNLASSTYWEETMLALPPEFYAVALDMRGYGLTDREALIDATRGYADWADDVVALADALDWERFHLVAHSLGGCIAWALLGAQPERLSSVTLVAPGPACGFGGARGERGELTHDDGAGSGAGLALPVLIEQLRAGRRGDVTEMFSPRGVINRLLWKPPFRPQREEDLLSAMLQVHLGERQLPGDSQPSPHWPGFRPGAYGPINAMSPLYNQWVLPNLLEAKHRPRLLWIYGAEDAVICDNSPSDAGTQGKLGLREGWPGEELFPPQPYLAQVQFALDQYEKRGGSVQRLILSDVGHTPFIEQPEEFNAALQKHLGTQ